MTILQRFIGHMMYGHFSCAENALSNMLQFVVLPAMNPCVEIPRNHYLSLGSSLDCTSLRVECPFLRWVERGLGCVCADEGDSRLCDNADLDDSTADCFNVGHKRCYPVAH